MFSQNSAGGIGGCVNTSANASTCLSEVAEAMAISWISQEATPPHTLAGVVAQYRNLTVYRDTIQNPEHVDLTMDRLFDQLLAAATVKLTISGQAESQLRRIAKRDDARLTYSQRCDKAIKQWEAGVRV